MLFEVRHEEIKKMLEENGSVSVEELSKYFDISKVTVRKHLDIISKSGNISRVRGGAINKQKGTTYEPEYGYKSKENYEVKSKIGLEASSYIVDGQTVILDSGSTTWHVANYIKNKNNLTVVTNDLKIAQLLAEKKHIKVFLTGGIVRTNIFSCYGSETNNYIGKINADTAVLSADAIDIVKGHTNSDIEEAEAKKEMLYSSDKSIMVADSSKFNKICFAYVSELKEIDLFITDDKVPAEYIEYFRQQKIEYILTK